jgi:PadR family transcriptional regulator AphA
MSLPHAILGLLALEPATGYALTQTFSRSLGNAWPASHGQIYPELTRLEAAGLVEVAGRGARRSRTWQVTPAGSSELRRWLVEVEPSRGERSETALRTFLSPRLLGAADARLVWERELRASAKHRNEFLSPIYERLRREQPDHPFLPAVDLGLRMNATYQQWVRDQLNASLETGEAKLRRDQGSRR